MSGPMQGKTVLITGGNSGIGKFTAIGLAKLGAKVVFTSRNQRKGDVARAEIREAAKTQQVEFMDLDLADFASIERFAAEFLRKHERLDVLVLNAGLVLDERSTTKQGFETTFGVNHLGHMLLTELLLDRMKASAPARILVLSSDAHQGARQGLDFDDLMAERKYSGWMVYCRSKLANILYTRALAKRLEGTGITVNAVHPGFVASGFASNDDMRGMANRVGMLLLRPFALSSEKGARTSVWVASDPQFERETGGYYARCKPAKLTSAAKDDAAAERLWTESEKLIAEARAKLGKR
jgi:NAD(P)-dependent dehydrogenase (short-subunit alcohol dehydrogenase family)